MILGILRKRAPGPAKGDGLDVPLGQFGILMPTWGLKAGVL